MVRYLINIKETKYIYINAKFHEGLVLNTKAPRKLSANSIPNYMNSTCVWNVLVKLVFSPMYAF